jgi:shikimate kinase
MITTLIGMSGVGKTYHGKKLAKKLGVPFFDIDILIQEKLGLDCKNDSIASLAGWLGYPWEEDYEKKSEWYIFTEGEGIQKILETVGDAVISTTGSVIYCNPVDLQALQKYTNIVYLACDLSHIENMKSEFLVNPKPIIWRQAGLVNKSNLLTKYEKLLKNRIKMYEELADITIDYEIHKAKGFELE